MTNHKVMTTVVNEKYTIIMTVHIYSSRVCRSEVGGISSRGSCDVNELAGQYLVPILANL